MALIGFQQKVVPEVVVASKKVYVENIVSIQKCLNTAYDELFNFILTNHTCMDYCKAMFCNINNMKPEYQYVEAVLFLRATMQGNDKIKIYKLPQTEVVSAVHIGNFSTLQETHIDLSKWIKENNYKINGAYRELYYKYDLRNLNDTITEIQYPVTKL